MSDGGWLVTRTLRVAHIGTGRTGSLVLRLLLATPGVALVGHYVHSPEKAGRDSGELVDVAPAGVSATADFDAFAGSAADCVTYLAATTGRAMSDVVDEHCALLATGKNVVTTALGDLVHPAALGENALTALTDACHRGGTSLLAAGIAPGFATDALPVEVATLTANPTKVTVSERILCGSYRVPGFFSALGFGTTPAVDAQAYRPGTGAKMFGPSIMTIADGLGWQVDHVRDRKHVAVSHRDFSCAAGDVPAGTIVSVRLIAEGLVDGEPRVTISETWSLCDEVVDHWEPRPPAAPPPRWTRVTVDGTPSVSVDLALGGTPLPGADATAARVVNAVAAVCAASPGVYGVLDLPVRPRLTAQRARG